MNRDGRKQLVPGESPDPAEAVAQRTRNIEGKPQMQCSITLDYTMRAIWGDKEQDIPKEATAIASYIKNHKVNPENVLEVIHIMWPEATMEPHIPADVEIHGERKDCEVWYYVKFADDSSVLVVSKNGIGDSIEVL